MRDKFNNYSFWRIKNILENDYHYRLERINQGYKANRRRNFVELYNLIDNNTNSNIKFVEENINRRKISFK